MPKHKTQKSTAKPVWMPLKREHYRERPVNFHKTVLYPNWLRSVLARIGDIRSCPHSLSVDTNRWFQRCPEQFVLGFKSFEGDLYAELAHTMRYPSGWDPFYVNPEYVDNTKSTSWSELSKPLNIYAAKVKRKADKYQQHTRTWRYNLSNPDHAQAYLNLLHYSTAYAAGEADQGTFRDLYALRLGDRKEIARWPISGLMYYDGDDHECVPLTEGYEVLEAVSVPGERPPKPKILCYPRPHHHGSNKIRAELYEHYVGDRRQKAKNAAKRAQLLDKFYRKAILPLAKFHTTNCQKRGCEHDDYGRSTDNCGMAHTKRVVTEAYRQAKKIYKRIKKLGHHPGSRLLAETLDMLRQAKEDTDQIKYIVDNVQKKGYRGEWYENYEYRAYFQKLGDGLVREKYIREDNALEPWNFMFDPEFIRPNCVSAIVLRPGFREAVRELQRRGVDTYRYEELDTKRKLPRYYYEMAMGSDKEENFAGKNIVGDETATLVQGSKNWNVGPFRKAITKAQSYHNRCQRDYQKAAEDYQYLLIDEEKWDREKALYDKRCSYLTGLKKIELRLRRIGKIADNIEVDAFYQSYNAELDIPLKAARSISKRFPAFWARTFNLYQAQGNKPLNSLYGKQRRNYKEKALIGNKGRAKPWSQVRNLKDLQRKKEYEREGLITRKQTEYRQMRWKPDLVGKYLNPSKVAYLCKPQAEHGLFLVDWAQDVTRDSQDYMLRLALAQDGLLRWNPDWSVSREQASQDYKLSTSQTLKALQQAALVFALHAAWNLKRRGKSTGEPISFRRAGHFTARSVFKSGCISNRGPPVA